MDKRRQKTEFNPSGVGLKNGNFIGLPFTEETANVILLSVPWDVTVSFEEGTALAPERIREASTQLDLYDADIKDAWKLGIFMPELDKSILRKSDSLRKQADRYIDFLESGGKVSDDHEMKELRDEIDRGCSGLNRQVYERCTQLIQKNKLIGLVGGEHSVPLGLIQALAEKFSDFSILQIDAHHDLRKEYEGFQYSHASIFYNALKINSVSKLVQVGIRDYCEEEAEFAEKEKERVITFYNQQLKEARFSAESWRTQSDRIIQSLPENVYVSFDVDGLDPKLCPHTGTPVPGGLDFDEAVYLIKTLAESGRKIIGFDVCETGNHEWDANVSARLLYKLSNWAGRSQGLI